VPVPASIVIAFWVAQAQSENPHAAMRIGMVRFLSGHRMALLLLRDRASPSRARNVFQHRAERFARA
jgi:hypothetical protein